MKFHTFELKNGLKVIVHPDKSIQIAVLNIMYNVGSRDEDEDKTGFAHLFEHLMFGGSGNIEEFDEELQRVGGENNAFTSPDVTNYYITVPAPNLETAFWLESDRMLRLSFKSEPLEVQRKVVIEEFKQRYLNQPYGDAWLKLRPLAYTQHPYKWATIGKEIKHIEDATMEDVKAFFKKFYIPNNAVLVIGGCVEIDEVERLAKKWFEPIPSGTPYRRQLPSEPKQNEAREEHVYAPVPSDALFRAYHMSGRTSPEYYSCDLLSDILGRGKSSRLHQELVQDKALFNQISAYINSSFDPGLLIISGHIRDGIDLEHANASIDHVLDKLLQDGINDDELEKVKNQAESTIAFEQVDVLERCISLAYASILGDLTLATNELEKIESVKKDDIIVNAQKILRKENCSTLYYHAKS